jgi:hypothetical protein
MKNKRDKFGNLIVHIILKERGSEEEVTKEAWPILDGTEGTGKV